MRRRYGPSSEQIQWNIRMDGQSELFSLSKDGYMLVKLFKYERIEKSKAMQYRASRRLIDWEVFYLSSFHSQSI